MYPKMIVNVKEFDVSLLGMIRIWSWNNEPDKKTKPKYLDELLIVVHLKQHRSNCTQYPFLNTLDSNSHYHLLLMTMDV
jgi:hypothetical protein